MKFFLNLFLAFLMLITQNSYAATKALQGDTWKSNNLSKTYTPPSITDTLAGLADIQTFTNKVINGSSNTLTNVSLTTAVTGTLPIGNGGTGQTTANAGFNALAPSQTSNSGKLLTTDGTNTSWVSAPATGVTSVAMTVPSFLSIAGSPITTTGTLAVTLSGTALPLANGGTGQTSKAPAYDALSPLAALGDMPYGGTSGTGTALAGNITTTKKYLSQTGNGAVSAAPSWSQPAFSELSGSATGAQMPAFSGDISTSAGSTVTTIGATKVTNAMLAGSIAASKLVGSDIATVGTITAGTWNGTTVAIANGGTGQTTATAATNALLPSQGSASGKFLTSDGTNTSWGVAALTTQGQSEGGGVTTTTVNVPYNQLTTTGTNQRLIETGNRNLLLNPSFEHTTYSTSWGALGSTTPSKETTIIRHGLNSAKLVLSAQSGVFWFQNVTPTIQTSAMNMEYGMAVNNTATGIQVCALNGGSIVGTCKDVLTDGLWHYYPVYYPGPANGTSVGVGLYSSGGSTGTMYADDAYVGDSRNAGIATFDTSWTSYTPVWNGFGTPTNVALFYKVTSGSLFIKGKFTTGTVTAAGAQLGLPNSYTIDGNVVASARGGGVYYRGTATTTHGGVLVMGASNNYLLFSDSSVFGSTSSNALTTVNASTAFGNSEDVSIEAGPIPISNLASQVFATVEGKQPTTQRLTSGTTYTTPAGVSYIEVELIGAGGGGVGQNGSTTGVTAATNSTFGTSLLTGGLGGNNGNAGGTVTINSPATVIDQHPGATGYATQQIVSSTGGDGASGLLGGGGVGGSANNGAGSAGIANSGSGGGAGGGSASTVGGQGGSAGGWLKARILNPAASYPYVIGAGGHGSTATGNGGNGADGVIIVTEYYGTYNFIFASDQITKMGSYNWDAFIPTNNSGTVTNAPSTGTLQTPSATYMSFANSSGTVTVTFNKIGKYQACVSEAWTAGNTYTFSRLTVTLGGTATRYTSNSTLSSTGQKDTVNSDHGISRCFGVAATALSQTLTVLPKQELSSANATSNFNAYADLSITYQGTY